MSQSTPASDPSATSDDRLWALLCYIFTPLIPVITLLMEDKKNRPFIKAHNVQALAWGIALYAISTILSPLAGIGCIVAVAGLVISIVWALKANKGEYVNIPVITDFCKKQGWS